MTPPAMVKVLLYVPEVMVTLADPVEKMRAKNESISCLETNQHSFLLDKENVDILPTGAPLRSPQLTLRLVARPDPTTLSPRSDEASQKGE